MPNVPPLKPLRIDVFETKDAPLPAPGDTSNPLAALLQKVSAAYAAPPGQPAQPAATPTSAPSSLLLVNYRSTPVSQCRLMGKRKRSTTRCATGPCATW